MELVVSPQWMKEHYFYDGDVREWINTFGDGEITITPEIVEIAIFAKLDFDAIARRLLTGKLRDKYEEKHERYNKVYEKATGETYAESKAILSMYTKYMPPDQAVDVYHKMCELTYFVFQLSCAFTFLELVWGISNNSWR